MIREVIRRAGLASRLTVFVVLAALVVPPALAADNACEAAVSERLARMNIDSGDVRSTGLAARIGTRRGGSVTGYDAWVNLKSCRGSIVLHLNRRCRVKDVYSKGECKFPDLPHY